MKIANQLKICLERNFYETIINLVAKDTQFCGLRNVQISACNQDFCGVY